MPQFKRNLRHEGASCGHRARPNGPSPNGTREGDATGGEREVAKDRERSGADLSVSCTHVRPFYVRHSNLRPKEV